MLSKQITDEEYLAQGIFVRGDNTYRARIGLDWQDDMYCSVAKIPLECMLFRASLEWLVHQGCLEDGDATHDVEKSIIEDIKAWAIYQGYPFEAL